VRLRVELEAVVADELDSVHAHEPARVVTRATAHAGHEQVAAHEPSQLGARLGGDCGELRPGRDRRERSVHVEDERAPSGVARKRSKKLGGLHRPA
jgi:hypothetical protein